MTVPKLFTVWYGKPPSMGGVEGPLGIWDIHEPSTLQYTWFNLGNSFDLVFCAPNNAGRIPFQVSAEHLGYICGANLPDHPSFILVVSWSFGCIPEEKMKIKVISMLPPPPLPTLPLTPLAYPLLLSFSSFFLFLSFLMLYVQRLATIGRSLLTHTYI